MKSKKNKNQEILNPAFPTFTNKQNELNSEETKNESFRN